jgi:hypothetical protein
MTLIEKKQIGKTRDGRTQLSPVFSGLQSDHVRANAAGFFAAGGEAVGFVVLLADSGGVARFIDEHASGGAQGGAKIRFASDEGHAIAEIARVVGFKPQAAATFRAGVAIARNVGGEKSFTLPQTFQADFIGLTENSRADFLRGVAKSYKWR